jgi:type IV pilus assembly protein PilM
MVEWKKDMKLSDLLARNQGERDAVEDEAKTFDHEPAVADELAPEVEATDDQNVPFWKRELGFRRQKAEDEEVEAEFEAEKRPFFKRGLSFRDAEDATTTDFEPDATEDTDTTPFWKRDLGFGRRRHDDAVEASAEVEEDDAETDAGAETPFWKRELFGRRRDDASAEDSFEEEEEPEEVGSEKTPFWKRELRFGRRDDDVSETIAEDPPEESAVDDAFEAETAEKKPFWKRELRFGRREHDVSETFVEDTPEHSAADEALEPETAEKKPFWKRELGFGRRTDDTAEPFEHEAEEPVAAEFYEPDAPEKTPFWKRELRFGRRDHDETPELEHEFEHEPVAHDVAEPVPADEPEAEAEPVVVTPVAEVETVDAAREPDVEFETREEPADHEPEPLVAAMEEPATADEAPAEDTTVRFEEPVDDSDEAPFWKREIKFGRRRGDEQLGAPAEFPAAVEPEPVAAAAEAEDETDGKPFWRRELKFRRGPREARDEDFDLIEEDEKKRSFKFSLRRTKDPDFDAPKPEKQPFFKRQLSFGRKGDAVAAPPGRSGRGRTKQLIGLKIGASQVAAAHVVNNGSPEVVQLERQSIEQGIVVGGELRDPDALAEVLREFFSKHKLPNKNVRLGIGNNRIGVRSFEISGVHDPKQLENAVRFRAQEALPIPLDEAVLDYQVIDETVSPTGIRTYRVLLVVAYRELIDRYVAACRGAGLRLVGIDLEAFALLRALSPPPAEGLPEDTALVAVAIGHDRSTFAVSNGTVCEFTRVLDWGGSSLNTAIARALDVTPSQAEPVKRTLSLSDGEDGSGPEANEHTIRAEEAVRLELQTFARELVSSLHFYQNQPGSLAIGSITLTGGTAHLPGLAAELQRLIGVKVRVGDPLRRVKTAKRVETPAQVGSMAVAIGLGIED